MAQGVNIHPFHNIGSGMIMKIEEPVNPNLHEKAEALPAQPGVYVFKDESGKPIYVGKAKSLRVAGALIFPGVALGG